ncbi:MAG: hypothetical protein JJLCMIEE_03663 [Acidimicrobiales bacterium]|nr:MAG: hypothetical protein EDR02_11960 [Actinomycetota bacterium]MBV6510505.1 hypothetical protein [Acidimicrobiales bacterium]
MIVHGKSSYRSVRTLLLALLLLAAVSGVALLLGDDGAGSRGGTPGEDAGSPAQPPVSVLGETSTQGAAGYPDEASTGPPASGALEPSGGLTVTEDGAVIEGLSIEGSVTVEADDVTIRDSRVETTGEYAIIADDEVSGLVIEDVELVGAVTPEDHSDGQVSAGIAPYGSWTLRRANIHGFIDGVKVKSNQVVEGCWIHGLLKVEGSHNDGIQSVGGENVVIRNNRVEGPYQGSTSAMILAAGSVGYLEGYTIEANMVSGGTYTIYVSAKEGRPSPSGIVVRDNVWLADSWKNGPLSMDPGIDVEWSGNSFDDGTAYDL